MDVFQLHERVVDDHRDYITVILSVSTACGRA